MPVFAYRRPPDAERDGAKHEHRNTEDARASPHPLIVHSLILYTVHCYLFTNYHMHTYEAKKFTLPSLEGISDESVKQHIGLYEGYVKNFNAISGLLPEYAKESEKNAHALSELIRRRSFEFGGMRLHEHYFAQLEGGSTPLTTSGPLAKALERDYMKA